MKIAITGASGFLGREFVKSSSINYDILALSRKKIDSCGCIVYKDLFEVEADELKGCDVFIHLAGLAHKQNVSFEEYCNVNVHMTVHLAKKAANAGVKRFVFMSSIGVNGFTSNGTDLNENSEVKPFNYYTQSKYLAELELKKVSKELDIELVIIRPPLVYGKNAPGNFRLLNKLIKKTPLLPFRHVNNKRSFIFILNLVDFIKLCCLHENAKSNVFFVSDGSSISIETFTNAIANANKCKVIQVFIPKTIIIRIFKILKMDGLYSQLYCDLSLDISKAKKTLNWTPPFDFDQSISETFES